MPEITKDNAMLVDIQYVKASKTKGHTDYLYIIWKDINTGEKYLKVMPEPMMTIYYEKPEFRNHNNWHNYAKLDECYPVTVKYKDILYNIVENIGPVARERMNQCFQNGDFNALKEFYAFPYVFGADFDVRAWYRYNWKKNFSNDLPKHITKGFMDIEVDSLESIGFPNPQFNPIDLTTIIDSDNKEVYTFALIGVECEDKDTSFMTEEQKEKELERRQMYKNRLEQQGYWSTHVDELNEEAHKMFDENYPDFHYNFYFYKEESKMIIHLFQLINKLKLDMIAIWNISFDFPYIIERLKGFGLDPAEVICPKEFPVKQCYFKKDIHHFDIKNKTDCVICTSYTIFIDQMINYAAIRKGGSELRRNNLSYIAEKEIGDEKLDYSDFGNIKTLSYTNYLEYILYNIKDVLLQVGIENRTKDFETYYTSSYENMTPYESVFKQTVTLRNVQYESFAEQGLVPGNNINQIYGKVPNTKQLDEDGNEIEDSDDPTFEGALVGNPKLITKFGEKLYGQKTNNIFRYSIDLDMSAFYPNTIMTINIDPSTLIFKVIVKVDQFEPVGGKLKFRGITDTQVFSSNKDYFKPGEDVGKEICDNFQTRNYLSFGKKWLNLPSVNEVYERMKEKYG